MKVRLPIHVQLLSLVLSIVVPLTGLLLYTKYEEATDDVKNASNSTLNLAQITAASTEQFLGDSQILLSHLAQYALKHDVVPAECDGFLSSFRDLPNAYANFLVADATGRLICSAVSVPSGQAIDYSDRQWFQRVMKDDQFTIGDPVIGRTTGKWSVPMAYPLHNAQGKFVGALSMPLDLVRYQFMLDGVTLPPHSILTLVDHTGTVLARAPDPSDLVGENVRGKEVIDIVLSQSSGYTQAQGLDGIERIFGFTTIASTGWHVYVGIPTDAVLENVRAETLRNSVIALVILMIALALAIYIGRGIAHSIRALAHAASEVKHGRFETRAPLTGPLEVVQVAAEFNAMLDVRIQIERALRDSEAHLRMIIDHLPTMFWTTDADLRFTSSVGEGFKSLNIEPNYLVGRSLYEIVNTTDPRFPAIQAHLQALKGQCGAYELYRGDRIYESHVGPLYDDDKHRHIVGVMGVGLDITERKKAEQALRKSEELFRAMIENSTDGIALLTADGTITYGSPGAARISGYTIEEDPSRNRLDLVHPDDVEKLKDEWSKLLQNPGAISSSEFRILHKNGSLHWVERILHNLLSDPIVGAVISNYRDITERKQAEESLRHYTVRLEIQHEIDEAIVAARSLQEIAAAVLNRVTGLVLSQEAHISLFDFETRMITVYARVPNTESGFAPGTQTSFDSIGNFDAFLDRLRRGQVVVIENISYKLPDSALIQGWVAGGQRDLIAAPLRVKDELIGTLSLSREIPANFSAEDTDIVHELGNSLAVAITQVRLFEDVSAARDRLQTLSRRLVEAQEAARRRLSQDLHDQVGTNLTALGINLSVLRSELSSRAAKKVEARLTDSLKLLDEAQDRIRGVMTDLRPAVLDDYGLEAALRWYVGQFSKRTGLEVVVHSPAFSPRLPSEVETGLFRITQEALTNVTKHAQATHVTITLEKRKEVERKEAEGIIRLIVADDGVGFNTSAQHEPGKQRGLGLVSMVERAESLGGRFRVESVIGKGTQVIVEVPL